MGPKEFVNVWELNSSYSRDQWRIQPVRSGGQFQLYLIVKSQTGLLLHRLRDEVFFPNTPCDETTDDKMELCLECCFPICTKP